MPELIAQLPLPSDGYCWRCQNRRVLPVAATAITPDGDCYCIEELAPYPDSRPTETWQGEDP
jgi:hypothetical protein